MAQTKIFFFYCYLQVAARCNMYKIYYIKQLSKFDQFFVIFIDGNNSPGQKYTAFVYTAVQLNIVYETVLNTQSDKILAKYLTLLETKMSMYGKNLIG